MSVKRGYKQTDVGVIPEEWTLGVLRDLVDPDRKITYGIVVPGPIAPNGVPMIRAQDYSKGWVALEDLYRVSHWIDKAYARSRVVTGDLLLTIVGSVGKLAKVPVAFSGSNITQQTARLAFDPKLADADYYLNILLSDVGRKVVTNYTKSGVQPSLNLSDIEKFVLPLPPLPEQRAIAAALSDVDALIASLDRLIAKKRDLKQAAMQQLLTGQTRLPGFGGKWEDACLGQRIDGLEAGVSVNSIVDESLPSSDGKYILKTSAVTGGKFLPNECKRIAPRDLARARLNPRCDTLLISRMNTPDLVGECGYVDRDYSNLFVPDRVWMTRFRPDAGLNARWLAYVLSTPWERKRIGSVATGTSGSMKNLSKPAFLSLSLHFPSGVEQTAIATILSDMDAELTALEQRRDKTKLLKQGMMQELLTGRTRLV